jgi:DNA repair photolyase
MGLSPGLDFESKLYAKPDAPELLEKELAAADYEPRMIAIGTNTDPYQPIERERKIMRAILEVLERAGHPVGIVTKSALVVRDIDILARMARRNLAKVGISVTTLDPKLARTMEPRASTPPRRLDAIRQLSQAGVPTIGMVAPVIPALNDSEIERILDAVAHAGAKEASYVLLRLPLEVHADEGHRTDGLDDRTKVRDRLREAGSEQAPHQAHDGSFRQAQGKAAELVLMLSCRCAI